MKFPTQLCLFALALGVTAIESPTLVPKDEPSLVERDIATITNVVNNISQKLTALDDAVKSFSGLADAQSLNSAASALSSSITSGVSTILASSNLSLNDAVSLQSVVSGLQSSGSSLVTDLVSKKQTFEQAALCDTILQQSKTLSSDSNDLINAVISKVPQEAQSIAQSLASSVVATLQQTQADFAQGNCTDTAGASGGGSTASSGASSPTGTPTTAANATTAASTGTASSSPATFTGAAVLNKAAVPLGGFVAAIAALLM